ncbi:hypothetical protein [Enterovibrio sp. 27052020O]
MNVLNSGNTVLRVLWEGNPIVGFDKVHEVGLALLLRGVIRWTISFS